MNRMPFRRPRKADLRLSNARVRAAGRGDAPDAPGIVSFHCPHGFPSAA
jgi:hypothetical protein